MKKIFCIIGLMLCVTGVRAQSTIISLDNATVADLHDAVQIWAADSTGSTWDKGVLLSRLLSAITESSSSFTIRILDSAGVDTEAEVEALLVDVSDIFTNNDGALSDDDLSDNNTTDLANISAHTGSGTVVVFNGNPTLDAVQLDNATAVQLQELNTNGNNYVEIRAADLLGGDITLILGDDMRSCSAGEVIEVASTGAGTVTLECDTDGGGGGSSIVLDLGDDSSNESSDIGEIATTGDTNSIFTEPTPDKLLIAVGNDWPKADEADALVDGDFGDVSSSSGSITIDNDAVDAAAIAADAVNASEIATDAVNADEIAADQVGTSELDDDANTPTAGDVVIVEVGGNSFDYLTPAGGTDITADLEEEAHQSEHEDGGADEVAVTGGMMNADFGDYTCDGTATGCTLDSGVVDATAIGTDAIGTDELDDDANSPTAGYFVVVETGAASFDYLQEIDSTHIANGGILTGDMGNSDFGDFSCTGNNTGCTLDTGVVDANELATDAVAAIAIQTDAVNSDEIAEDQVGTSELDDDANSPTAGDFVTVETGANSFTYTAPNSGTDVTADLEEETHVTEHEENGADELLVESAGTACTDGEGMVSDGSGGVDCSDGILVSKDGANFVSGNVLIAINTDSIKTAGGPPLLSATDETISGRWIFDAGLSSPFETGGGIAEIVDGSANDDTLRWDWATASNFTVTLDEDTFVENPSNLDEGYASMRICQDGTGNDQLTQFDTAFDNTVPIHEQANECTTLFFQSYDGSNINITTDRPQKVVPVVIGAKDTDLATTDSTLFQIPSNWTITALHASVKVAPTGAAIDIDVQNGLTTSILSTTLTIDATEDGSDTAATSYVFASDHTLDQYAQLVVDVTQVGSTEPGEELTVWVYYID